MPFVSIILPTFNGKKEWISESIYSILNQSFTDFELIIINDASTNNIEETITNFLKKDKRIRYIKNEKNLKLTKTLNIGISTAKGKYIARIDDDDIWIDPKKLEKQVLFMENNSDFGVCGTQINIIDRDGKIMNQVKKAENNEEIKNKILYGCTFFHSSVLIRKSAIDELGGYSSLWDYIEDYELWLRIGTKYKFKNLSSYSINYRINWDGISYSNTLKQRKLSILVGWKYRKYYPNFVKSFLYKIYLFVGSLFVFIFKKSYIHYSHKKRTV